MHNAHSRIHDDDEDVYIYIWAFVDFDKNLFSWRKEAFVEM